MSGWHHDNVEWGEAPCKVCGTLFTRHGGSHKYCSAVCKGKWKYISGEMTTESQYKLISGNWRRYFSRLCCRCQKREAISVEDCLCLLEEQEGRCALSGVMLTCKLEKGKKFKTNASLDRKEAGGPYIKENVQLVCTALNSWRADTDLLEFIWWCGKVTAWQEGEGTVRA